MVNKKFIGLKISPEILKLLKKITDSLGYNRSEYIRDLISNDLKKYGLISDKIKSELCLEIKNNKSEG